MALKLLSEHGKLRRAALIPTLLTLVGCLVFAYFDMDDDASDPSWRRFLAAFAALTALPPTFLMPLWVKLALESRHVLTAAPGDSDILNSSYFRMLKTEWMKVARQAFIVSIGVFPILLLSKLLSLPDLIYQLAAGLWAFYWMVLDAIDLPLEVAPGKLGIASPSWFEQGFAAVKLGWFARAIARFATPWRHAIHFTERHPAATTGFAIAAGLCLLNPIIGVFFRSLALVAATCLIVDDEQALAIERSLAANELPAG